MNARLKWQRRSQSRLVLRALCLLLGMSSVKLPKLHAQAELDMDARARVLPDVGAGVRVLKHGPDNRFYVLTASGPTVRVYNPDGKLAREIPAAPSKQNSIVLGSDMDVDSTGRVYVADRGANVVRVFSADGTPALTISVDSPTSVVSLPQGAIAVASTSTKHLVTLFDAQGKQVLELGDRADVTERPEVNRYLNAGRLAADPAGNIYYAFSFLPEPTFRKYDRAGHIVLEVEVTIPEYEPKATAMRRAIGRQEHTASPSFEPIVSAIAVDPETGGIWVVVGNQVLRFDREGTRRASYRPFAPKGDDLAPAAILIEADRVLLAADPLGVFEFARSDKMNGVP